MRLNLGAWEPQTYVAVVALIVTTGFTAVQMKRGADEAAGNRKATELQVFDSINSELTSSTATFERHRSEMRAVLADRGRQLSDATRADLRRALDDQNVFALLVLDGSINRDDL